MFSYYSLSGGGVRVRIQVICNAKNLRLVYTIRSGRNNLKTADNLRTIYLSFFFIYPNKRFILPSALWS